MANKAKILLVEDDVPTAEMVKILLSRCGCDASIAHTGKEGMGLALEFKFDLIILDIDLPDIIGFDLFSRLRKMAGTALTPILFISGRSDEANRRRGFKLGAVDYIEKPFSGSVFTHRILSHLKIKPHCDPTTQFSGKAKNMKLPMLQNLSWGSGGKSPYLEEKLRVVSVRRRTGNNSCSFIPNACDRKASSSSVTHRIWASILEMVFSPMSQPTRAQRADNMVCVQPFPYRIFRTTGPTMF